MDRIIQVINTIIENKASITGAAKQGVVYYFLYNYKHIFSIHEASKGGVLYFNVYPSPDYSIDKIIAIRASLDPKMDDIPVITYSSADYKTIEGQESFRELLILIKSKLYDVESVFNDILNNK